MVLEGLGSWNREQQTDGRTDGEETGINQRERGEKEGGWRKERRGEDRRDERRGEFH